MREKSDGYFALYVGLGMCLLREAVHVWDADDIHAATWAVRLVSVLKKPNKTVIFDAIKPQQERILRDVIYL